MDNITFMGYDLNHLDPNVKKDIHIYRNATVVLSENLTTGEIEVSWFRQPNTIEADTYFDEEWENN